MIHVISAEDLEAGYRWAYKEFYSWSNIISASTNHDSLKHMLKHFLYAGGWKKFEPLWNFAIKSKNLNSMLPLLEAILSKVSPKKKKKATRTQQEPATLNDFDINAAVAELKSKQNRVVHDHA